MGVRVELQDEEIVLIVEALDFLNDHPAFDAWEQSALTTLAERLARCVTVEAFKEASLEIKQRYGGGDAYPAG
jgi:hypothetical protein